ncbi:MAG TPA: phosphotransferase, partial [Ktedonobacterales bacterium]|nr:phosphotransferase [Ktedonobacterales bacterium]
MLDVHHQSSLFTEEDAERIALEVYGARAKARALPGERDANFYLETEQGHAFVLKIAPAGEQWETLDLQNQALEHLSVQDETLALPRVCATPAGETIEVVSDGNGTEHFARMLTYVPGRLFAQSRPHSPALLRSLGNWLGRVDSALQGFAHPTAERVLKWDLRQASWIREYLHCIASPDRRALVESLFSLYETDVLPALPTLRQSIIHNDANDYNVLVSAASEREAGQVVSVIDFGDMVYTATVSEVAIAAAYAMLDKPDPLAAAAAVVAGYHEAFPLREDELAVLYPLICTRLCVSVVNAAYQQQIEPENAYLQISTQPVWALLERLVTVHPRFAHYLFRAACGLPADPRGDSVVQWLRNNVQSIGRVVEPDLSRAGAVIFDLSIGSRELGTLADVADLEQFNRHIFERMRTANSDTGVGRYNEARP